MSLEPILASSAGGSVRPGATGLPEPPDVAERTILSGAVWVDTIPSGLARSAAPREIEKALGSNLPGSGSGEVAAAASPREAIERRILVVRGLRVMLDRDLADLYGVETKALVQAVKRNARRFPEDFAFRLSVEETSVLRSQIVTSSEGWGGCSYLPYARSLDRTPARSVERGLSERERVVRADVFCDRANERNEFLVRVERVATTPKAAISNAGWIMSARSSTREGP